MPVEKSTLVFVQQLEVPLQLHTLTQSAHSSWQGWMQSWICWKQKQQRKQQQYRSQWQQQDIHQQDQQHQQQGLVQAAKRQMQRVQRSAQVGVFTDKNWCMQ